MRARVAGGFYVLVFVTGSIALSGRGSVAAAAGLVSGVLYIAVTLLFYQLFKPVNRHLSRLAAIISLAGIAAGPLRVPAVNPLVFFGFYCALISYLIFRSTFLPRGLAALMAFAAIGWLTFLSPSLAEDLSPFNFAPGIIGEGALTLWLLVIGVNVPRWEEQARA